MLTLRMSQNLSNLFATVQTGQDEQQENGMGMNL